MIIICHIYRNNKYLNANNYPPYISKTPILTNPCTRLFNIEKTLKRVSYHEIEEMVRNGKKFATLKNAPADWERT